MRRAVGREGAEYLDRRLGQWNYVITAALVTSSRNLKPAVLKIDFRAPSMSPVVPALASKHEKAK
jgi:hypothetical protein